MTYRSTERWKPVPGYEGLYEASTHGRIRGLARRVKSSRGYRNKQARLLKSSIEPDGYAVVSLSAGDGTQKSYRWHRIILLTFRGECPPGMLARHLNGIRKDNRLTNLKWGTPEQNWQDRRVHAAERNSNGLSLN